LSVYPSNPQDFGFRGNLYITGDSAYALKRAELAFTKNAAVNFVNDFSLIQEYTLIDNTWCLTLDEAVIDFGLTKNRNAVLGKRTNIYTGYHFDGYVPDTVLSGINRIEKAAGYDMMDDEYWKENRPIELGRSEQGVYDLVEDMKNDRLFKHALNLSGIIYSGYIKIGPLDIGPIETLLSFNDVEGARVRLGGKTNTRFNRHLFLEGFAAYGFKDRRFKYRFGVLYSFNERKIHPWEYPMNLLHISYEDNIVTPGRFFMFGSGDRLLLSFYRGKAQKMVYHRTFNVKYDKEYASGFSFQPSFTHREEWPAGDLTFINKSGPVKSISSFQLGLKLRFAPNERFYQIQQNRYSLNHVHPVFTINYTCGMKGIRSGDNEFHRLELGMDKRSWFSTFGFADTWIKAGKIWGRVPFPLLVIHQANQNYAYQDRAFNMMNYMEFVSDTYAQANFSYCFNGWIFNRIPLVKKLKWREFISFNALWGNLSDNNRPDRHPELLYFPVNESGIPAMYSLEKAPYMEAGIAIDNIFKIVRVDLIKRLNYLNHPDVPEWGVRFRLRFVF
jgi:hypothetical protein